MSPREGFGLVRTGLIGLAVGVSLTVWLLSLRGATDRIDEEGDGGGSEVHAGSHEAETHAMPGAHEDVPEAGKRPDPEPTGSSDRLTEDTGTGVEASAGEGSEASLDAKETLVDLRNEVCPVMLNGVSDFESMWIAWDGVKVHFCCMGCAGMFLADPVTQLQLLVDEHSLEAPSWALDAEAHRPLVDLDNERSPVSGEPVQPEAIVVDRGILVRLASLGEVDDYLQEPDRYLRELAANGAAVPLDRVNR